MDQKNKSLKNHTKKHYREILRGALSLYKSKIFSNCSSLRNFGPFRQIPTSRSTFLLRHVRKGETRRFTTEKPRSTPEVDGEIRNDKWVDSKFACFVRLSSAFFECYFKPLCFLDVKKPK